MAERGDIAKGSETITVWIRQDIIDVLEDFVRNNDVSKNKLIRNIIGVGLVEIRAQEAIGLVKLNFLIHELKERWRKGIEEREQTGEGRGRYQRGVNITIRLDREVVDELEKWSNKLCISRSKLVESLIDMVSNVLRAMTDVGAFDFIYKIEKLWKKSFKEAKEVEKKGVLKLED